MIACDKYGVHKLQLSISSFHFMETLLLATWISHLALYPGVYRLTDIKGLTSRRRCTLIEPGPVETQFPFNINFQTEKTADEKSIQLRSKYENAFRLQMPGTTQWFQPVGEVAEIILTAILEENSDFRYQTTEILKTEAKKKFTDPTGYSNVEKINKRYFKD